MNIKKLNEELEKLILQERDRTFDDYDYDDLEEIVYSKYGAGYYILIKGKQYRVYEVFHEYYGTDISELGSFKTREKAIDCICHCFDKDDITEAYDHGDIKFYDSDVENYALEHAYFDEDEEDEEDEEEREEKTYKTFADWYGQDLTGQTYQGDIDCSEVGLISLQGAPEKVTGSFDCSYNNLTSLEFGPKEVKRTFNCSTQAEISKNALIKDESISEKLISNRRFRKNKKSEVDRLPENNTLDEIKAKLNKIPPEYYNKINDFLTSLKK